MAEKNWQVYLSRTEHLTQTERECLILKADLGILPSWHSTEGEARIAAKELLRKLKKVSDAGVGWKACYAEPYREGAGRGMTHRSDDAVPRCLGFDDLDD